MPPLKKYEQVLDRMRSRIYMQRDQGNLLLPGERELVRELDTSRTTLRKAMELLENEQLIYREKRATKIYSPRKQKFRYAYAVYGHKSNQTFWYPAYYLHWLVIQRLAQQRRIQVDLLLFDPEEDSPKKIRRNASKYDMIFITAGKSFADLFKGACENLVRFDPTLDIPGTPLITLDNVAIGRMAAEALQAAGCRKIAIIGQHDPKLPEKQTHHLLRKQGFMEKLRKTSIEVESAEHPMEYNWEYVEFMHYFVSILPERGFDGLFVTSDEYIKLIVSKLLDRKLCPGSFSIIAMDSVGEARNCHCPIDTISHDISTIADELLKIVGEYEDGSYSPTRPPVMLQPRLYPGRTLKQIPN